MTDYDDPKFAATLHVSTGTMLSAEAVTAICKWALEMDAREQELFRTISAFATPKVGFDANGSETP